MNTTQRALAILFSGILTIRVLAVQNLPAQPDADGAANPFE